MGLFGGGNDIPDAPDVSKDVDQFREWALRSGVIAEGRYDSPEAKLDDLLAGAQGLFGKYTPEMQANFDFASDLREMYQGEILPSMTRFREDAEGWASPERMGRESEWAGTQARRLIDQDRAAAAAELRRFGIDPTDPRYMGAMEGRRAEDAGAIVRAQNFARRDVENQGMALRAASIGQGAALPGVAQGATGQALGLGQAGQGNIESAVGMDAAILGNPLQWYVNQRDSLNSAVDTAFTSWRSEAARKSGGSGIGQMVGGIASLAGLAGGAYLGSKAGPWGAVAGATIGAKAGDRAAGMVAGGGDPRFGGTY